MMQKCDTIAAIATAMSGAGIGVVRISGEDAFEIAGKVFQPASRQKKLEDQKPYTKWQPHL